MHFCSPGDWFSRIIPERDWKSKFFCCLWAFCRCYCAFLNGGFVPICNRWIKLSFGKWKVNTAGFDQGVCHSLGRTVWPGPVETSLLTLVCVIRPCQSLPLHLCALQQVFSFLHPSPPANTPSCIHASSWVSHCWDNRGTNPLGFLALTFDLILGSVGDSPGHICPLAGAGAHQQPPCVKALLWLLMELRSSLMENLSSDSLSCKPGIKANSKTLLGVFSYWFKSFAWYFQNMPFSALMERDEESFFCLAVLVW